MKTPCPKSNVTICIMVGLSLNLGLLMVIAQVRIPFVNFDAVAQQFNSKAQPIYTASLGDKPKYRFLSCSGGDSVNCHTHGNQAGL